MLLAVRRSLPMLVLTPYNNLIPVDAHHRFVAEECDWGFTRFHDLRKLYNAQDHQKRPIIEDDTAEVTVFVRVLKDPTGVLWHNFQKCASNCAFVLFQERVSNSHPR